MMKVIPEDKMKNYLEYCKGKKIPIICDNCGSIIEVEFTPYCYDDWENDVHFASLCPYCGELLITKE